jgi:geranylgeranyl diphosphate synthase type II
MPSPSTSQQDPSLNRVLVARVEGAIQAALDHATGSGCPPRLADALRAAVLPGGARLRPQLCLLAAVSCGDAHPALAESAACALELIHCASLVHDDLPCFDDADLRRGRPSIHKAFGEALAVLTGDALIVAAFEVIASAGAAHPRRAAELVRLLAQASGSIRGLVAGQAWESEPTVAIDAYHRAKTGALFEAATVMGALAGGGDPARWRVFGDCLGRAYQAADDLRDLTANEAAVGKPTGRDALLGRPNLGQVLGVEGARARVLELVKASLAAIPEASERPLVQRWVRHLLPRLIPDTNTTARITAGSVP